MAAAEQLKIRSGQLAVAKRVAIRNVLKELSVLIPELVKIRTRGGSGIKGNLPSLKESTEAYRKRYAANLHPETSPSESNLTATGQMLDAMTAKVSAGRVTVSIKNTKRKRELSGGKSAKTNNEVRALVEKHFAEFFELTNEERNHLIELATQLIKEEILNVFKGA